MRANTRWSIVLLVLVCGGVTRTGRADPCGMVPPIYIRNDPGLLVRVGAQKTYVFYRNGLETFVIRPGFSGKVDEFGMLIPFPTPPAIRKVPDEIFAHIAAAVDPPELVVDLRPQRTFFGGGGLGGGGLGGGGLGFRLERDQVRVLREEAVGMYEVAVLEAGSAEALKKWVDEHAYRYPTGMDAACQDYVDLGWCFVAVKTRVGQKRGVEARPGMRKVDAKLPPGATFDGHVQAMGFRFRVDRLVVPMRLSAFNEGKLRNIVYLLTDGPRAIRSIPTDYVVRQIPGEQLVENLTAPLPVRVIGGTKADLRRWRSGLKTATNPTPHNGLARELFASDLVALGRGRLSHPYEEEEKELLRIGERLGLRGPELDKLHAQQLQADREKAIRGALRYLKQMTLTVIDGDFPRDVLARENLTFAAYSMPPQLNTPAHYDAKLFGPATEREGVRVSSLEMDSTQAGRNVRFSRMAVLTPPESTGIHTPRPPRAAGAWFAWSLLAVCSATLISRRVRARTGRVATVLVLSGLLALAALQLSSAAPKGDDDVAHLIRQLGQPDQANTAAELLIARGREMVPILAAVAERNESLTRRGWAIVCLAQIGAKEVADLGSAPGHPLMPPLAKEGSGGGAAEEIDQHLAGLHSNPKQPMLVRTWAAAARVELAASTDQLVELAQLVPQFPALVRPIGKRIVGLLPTTQGADSVDAILRLADRLQQPLWASPSLARPLAERLLEVLPDEQEAGSVEAMLRLANRAPALQAGLAPSILALGSPALARAMVSADDAEIRRQSAGYLAALEERAEVARTVLDLLRFRREAKNVPWAGGPLFLPAIDWQRDDARRLAGNLIAWHLWCDLHGNADEQRQIDNNLGTFQLANAAGYKSPGFQSIGTGRWLRLWGETVGRKQLERMLAEQGATGRYRAILDAVK